LPLDGIEGCGVAGAGAVAVLACIGQLALEEIEGSVEIRRHVEPGVRE
jgi:hypothetical protein